MIPSERSAELAVGWIDAWSRMDIGWLRRRLAPDFVHVSPFGRLEGRESYLASVEPMARKSVMDLSIRDVIATGNQAAIRFDNHTPTGVIETCDWVRVGNDTIQEVRSFYDGSKVRSILSDDELKRLDGST